jgi:hypothetical protein
MTNKEWSYGTHNGLNRRLKLVGYTFIEDDQPNPMITVFLREQLMSPTGEVVTDKAADYSVIKGKVSYDIDNSPLPKRNTLGEVQYQLDEEGNVTDIPLPRDNAYENIVYYVDNKIYTVYELIDAGVIERFKLV